MDKALRRYAVWGTVFSAIVGTMLHFTYEWSGGNPVIALFAAVNESTWEHLKIAVLPQLFFFMIEYFVVGKRYSNYWIAKLTTVASCTGIIVVVFYTYSAAVGHSILAVDITLFYLAILTGQWLGYLVARSRNEEGPRCVVAVLLLLLITAAFLCFTYFPPHLKLFCDPVTGGFGILK